MKLLLIEDDRQTADYLARELGEPGHACDHVANGVDGLAAAPAGPRDAV